MKIMKEKLFSFLAILLLSTTAINADFIPGFQPSNDVTILNPSNFLVGVKQLSKVFVDTSKFNETAVLAKLTLTIDEKNLCTLEAKLSPSEFNEKFLETTFKHTVVYGQDFVSGNLKFELFDDQDNQVWSIDKYTTVKQIKPDYRVQTDKPIYRPGEKLRLFVIKLDPYHNYIRPQTDEVNCKLKDEELSRFPIFPKKHNILLKNTQGKVFKVWKDIVVDSLKVFKVQLTDDIPEGVYNIYRQVGTEEDHLGSIEVENFVLPRFTGKITIVKVPETHTDGEIEVNICAKYTNGGVFYGSANVSLNFFDVRDGGKNHTVNLDGDCKLAKIPIENRKPTPSYGFNFWRPERTFKIKAHIKEYGTNVTILVTDEKFETNLKPTYVDKLAVNSDYPTFTVIAAKPNENATNFKINSTEKNYHYRGTFKNTKQKLLLPIGKQLFLTVLNDKGEEQNKISMTSESNSNRWRPMGKTKNWSLYPEAVYDYEGEKCPKKLVYHIMRSQKSTVRQFKILSQQPSVDFDEITVKLSEMKCEPRDDEFGHYTCEADGKIKCLSEWTGENCMMKKCVGDSFEEFCSTQANEEPRELSFYVDKFEIELANFIGSKISLFMYTFEDDSSELDSEILKVEKIKGCMSMVDKEAEKISLAFDKETRLPGEKINIKMSVNGLTGSNKGQCLLNLYDKSLENFFKDSFSNRFTFEDFLNYLNSHMIEAISYEYFHDLIVPRREMLFYSMKQDSMIPGSPIPEAIMMPEKKREFFPESWFFEMIDLEKMKDQDSFGFDRELIAPDTITSFVGNSICFLEEKGIFVPKEKPNFIVNKEFHVELQPPKFLVRNETVSIPLSVFFESIDTKKKSNYVTIKFDYDKDQITLLGVKEFDYCSNKLENNRQNVVYLTVKALKAGTTNITINAIAEVDSSKCNSTTENPKEEILRDLVVKQINIKPEGEVAELTETRLVCGSASIISLKTSDIKDIVDDSARFYTTLSTNSLGMSIGNLGKLVNKPYGCGEQNLASVYPSVSVLEYLKKYDEIDDSEKLIEKAEGYVRYGFNRELNFAHNDGSFSAFGTKDAHGSTWLTCHVIEVFSRAKKLIKDNFDVQKTLKNAYKFIEKMYNEKTCVTENGKIFDNPYKFMQGSDADTQESLSNALKYVRTIFHYYNLREDSEQDGLDAIKSHYTKVLKCLSNSYKDVNIETIQPILVAEYAYTIALIESEFHEGILEKLMTRMEKLITSSLAKEEFSFNDRSIELISYYLLIKSLSNTPVDDVLDKIEWLMRKQNSQGGYYSTTSTVLALDALSKFKIKKVSDEAEVTVMLVPGNVEMTRKLGVGAVENVQLTKYTSMPEDKLDFKYSFKTDREDSCILTKSTMFYNRKVAIKNDEIFKVNLKMKEDKKTCKLLYDICTQQLSEKETNMLLATFGIPSGYSLDVDSLKYGSSDEDPMKHEIDSINNKLFFYFNGFEAKKPLGKRCVSISLNQNFNMKNLAEAELKVEDYYDPSISSTTSYKPSDCSVVQIGKLEENKEMIARIFNETHLNCDKTDSSEDLAKTTETLLCEKDKTIYALISKGDRNAEFTRTSSINGVRRYVLDDFDDELVKVCLKPEDIKPSTFQVVIIHEDYNKLTDKFLNAFSFSLEKTTAVDSFTKFFKASGAGCQAFEKLVDIIKSALQV